MAMSKFLTAGAVLATLMTAGGPARAITPAELWSEWQDQAAWAGLRLAAESERREGEALLLDGVGYTGTQDDRIGGSLPPLRLEPAGAGEVRVVLPEAYTLEMREAGDGTATALTLDVAHPGLAMTASGGPGAVAYDYRAPTVTLGLAGLERDGEAVKDLDFEAALTGLSGRYVTSGTGTRRLQNEAQAQSAVLSLSAADRDDGATVVSLMRFSDLTIVSDQTLPQGAPRAGLAELLADGFTGRGEMTWGESRFDITADRPRAVTASGDVAGGRLAFAIDAERAAWEAENRAGRVALSGEELPDRGMELAWEAARLALDGPLGQRPEAEDAAFSLALDGLTVSDAAWEIFDPDAVLDRSPARLAVETTGRMRWTTDMSDPEALRALGNDLPFALETARIERLALAFGGAELTGTGAFTFPPVARGELPHPRGAVELVLRGGDRFLNALVTLGLVDQGQAMIARLMAAAFAVPGPDPDTLTTRIEITETGIRANGRGLP